MTGIPKEILWDLATTLADLENLGWKPKRDGSSTCFVNSEGYAEPFPIWVLELVNQGSEVKP